MTYCIFDYRKQQKERLRMEMKYPKKQFVLKYKEKKFFEEVSCGGSRNIF